MSSMSDEYNMDTFRKSPEYTAALRELRRVAGITRRAERRLSGNVSKRRRASKAKKSEPERSSETAESG